MNRNKKMLAALVSGVLLVTMLVGGTLAYLHKTTETVQNTFSSNKSIGISLREPLWDGYTFENVSDEDYLGGTQAMNAGSALGFNQAARYVPGDAIPKNPIIKNTGTQQEPVYTAMKLQYYIWNEDAKVQVTYEQFADTLLQENGIQFSNQFTRLSDSDSKDQIYLYGSNTQQGTVLPVGEETPEIFTSVPLSIDLAPAEDGTMPRFAIEVTGYAIQAANVAAEDAGTMLLDFIQN